MKNGFSVSAVEHPAFGRFAERLDRTRCPSAITQFASSTFGATPDGRLEGGDGSRSNAFSCHFYDRVLSMALPVTSKASTRSKMDDIFDSMRDRLLDRISSDREEMVLLDLGAGPNGYVLKWKEYFGQSYALDVKDYSASYIGTDVKFLLSDGICAPLPDGSVDIIVSHSAMEHVGDLEGVLTDCNRLLKRGGHVYVTISPLYYSPAGLHRSDIFKNWEHLDPRCPAYLSDTPFFETAESRRKHGSSLNKLTCSEFLAAVGKQPWQIDLFEPKYVSQLPPAFIDTDVFGKINLITKGFSFVGTKML